MKNFDIESIELSMNQLKEIGAEVRRELEKKQAYYAKLCGIDRQMINAVVKGRSNFKNETLINVYKAIRKDLQQQQN